MQSKREVLNLPLFKVGQVWQCRNQKMVAKIVTVRNCDLTGTVLPARCSANIFEGMISPATLCHDYGYTYLRGNPDAYQVWMERPDDCDLVHLIYDPDWTTDEHQ